VEDEIQKRKRPVWVWIISIFFFFSAGWTLLSFYLVGTGVIPLNTAQQAYFDSLTALDYGLTILVGLANLIGAIALFFLRKIALHLFASALTVNFLMLIWHALNKGWVAAISGPGLVGAFIGWGVLLAVCAYAWKLTKSGVLT